MAITLKKVAIVLGSLALAGMLIFAVLIALVIRSDNAAKARATSLCAPTLVGATADIALDRAIKSESASRELRWRDYEDGRAELLAVFPAGLPLSGYICTISAKDGVVTAADITTVD